MAPMDAKRRVAILEATLHALEVKPGCWCDCIPIHSPSCRKARVAMGYAKNLAEATPVARDIATRAIEVTNERVQTATAPLFGE